MADNWDEEDFEPGEFQTKKGDQWEGEDEDDGALKENWDDEDEEKNNEETEQTTETTTAPIKKKKTVKQKILEREEQKKEEALRKAQLKKEMEENQKDDDDDESIFASEMAEKLRQQKLVEEADLEVTKETFGILGGPGEGKKSIDAFKPTSKEEFCELAKMIVDKLTPFETSIEYPGFLEILIRDLATGLDVDEVKKLGSVLNVLASEKQKAQKATKGKKKGKKAVLGGSAKGTKGVDLEDYSTYGDEYDDFM